MYRVDLQSLMFCDLNAC